MAELGPADKETLGELLRKVAEGPSAGPFEEFFSDEAIRAAREGQKIIVEFQDEELRALKEENAKLKARNAELRERVAELERTNA